MSTAVPAPLDAGALRVATAHLRRADPVLAAVIRAVGPCGLRAERRTSAFAALAESIVYQQISGKAAASIHRRVLALAGGARLKPQHIAAASAPALRACGLSRQKAAFLRDLAARAQGGLRLAGLSRHPDEAVIEALIAVKGIGRWTAEMFLIFRLGRADVWPVDDYGIRKAMQRAYRRRELPRPDWMRQKAEPWRPYRSVASWYLWRSLELPRTPSRRDD